VLHRDIDSGTEGLYRLIWVFSDADEVVIGIELRSWLFGHVIGMPKFGLVRFSENFAKPRTGL
jgi:hypothetical protein